MTIKRILGQQGTGNEAWTTAVTRVDEDYEADMCDFLIIGIGTGEPITGPEIVLPPNPFPGQEIKIAANGADVTVDGGDNTIANSDPITGLWTVANGSVCSFIFSTEGDWKAECCCPTVGPGEPTQRPIFANIDGSAETDSEEFVTIPDLSITATLTETSDLEISFTATARMLFGGEVPAAGDAFYRILVDGVPIVGQAGATYVPNVDLTIFQTVSQQWQAQDLFPGDHTVEVQWRIDNDASGNDIQIITDDPESPGMHGDLMVWVTKSPNP